MMEDEDAGFDSKTTRIRLETLAKLVKTTHTIQVKRCSDRNMWYANRVGAFVDVQRVTPEGVWSRGDGGYLNFIKYEDLV